MTADVEGLRTAGGRVTLDPEMVSDPAMVAAFVADAGWPVIAIEQGTKAPLKSGGKNHQAAWLRTPREVLDAAEGMEAPQGWTQARSFAVMTGIQLRQGPALVALDLDGDMDELAALLEEAGPEAQAWARSTARAQRCEQRMHLYGVMEADDVPTTGLLAPGLEWRGRGGYVLLPKSKHPQGKRYEFTGGAVVLNNGESVAGSFYAGWRFDESTELQGAEWRQILPVPASLLDVVARRRGPARPIPLPSPRPISDGQPRALDDAQTTAKTGEVSMPTDRRADAYSARALAAIAADLDASSSWPVGYRDDRGRGWEKLQADKALRLARLALADRSPVTMAEAEAAFLAHAPVGDGTTRHRATKWRDQRRRAEQKGALELPVDEFTGFEFELVADDQPSADTREEDAGDAMAEERPGTSWQAVDLTVIVAGLRDGTLERPRPTVGALSMSDTDEARALFYRGKVNGLAGESGCGKSFVAMAVSAQEMREGRAVVFIDPEDSAVGAVSRLLDMGVRAETITQHFHYLSPTEGLSALAWLDLAELLDEVAPSLVVIDSTGEGLSIAGRNPNADEEVAAWFRSVPRRIADHPTTPAVLVLDHVTKTDDGGLWPIGSQRKRAAINGAQYMLRLVKQFSRDQAGSAVLTVAKDRHGHYRHGQKVAQLHVAPAGDGRVQLDLMYLPDTAPAEGGPFRPTVLMERVSRYLENHPGAADRTARQVRTRVQGKEKSILDAADLLVMEGFAVTEVGAHAATVYTSLKPFRAADDRGTNDDGRTEPIS